MKSKTAQHTDARTFADLTAQHSLRPIRNEADFDRASKIAEGLAILDRRSRDQEDYLQTLSLLIEAYEDQRHMIDISDLDPVDILRSLMEDRGMSASELGRVLGNRSLGPAILRGDRQLSKTHIMVLCEHFAVGPELFLKQPRRLRKAG